MVKFIENAAKVLENLHERFFWVEQRVGDHKRGDPAAVHDAELEKVVFQGTVDQCTDFIYKKMADGILRWLLTQEPTDAMVEAGFDAPPIPPMRAAKGHYAKAYRAMNAARLKEIDND